MPRKKQINNNKNKGYTEKYGRYVLSIIKHFRLN